MRKLMIAVIAIATLAACGGRDWTENPDQQSFYRTFINSESTDAQVDQLRSASSRPVADWNARITNVYESDPFTIIEAQYGSMLYRLFIFGDEDRAKARTLKKEAFLIFSGDLGPEQSTTRFGATVNPEFEFYPTSVTSGAISINQEATRIAEHEIEDRKGYEEARRQNEKEALDSSIEERVVELCRQAVLENLQYPASGSFSWFKKQVSKESESKWVYSDVITAKNSIGADLPSRFVCNVTINGENMSANVRFLDGI